MKNFNSNPIILFDDECNLCNWAVCAVKKFDKKNIFSLYALQSEKGHQILKDGKLRVNPDSVVLVEHGKIYVESTAVLRILSRLSYLKVAYIFILVPKFMRDAIYRFIAKNRYSWFGKKAQCPIR